MYDEVFQEIWKNDDEIKKMIIEYIERKYIQFWNYINKIEDIRLKDTVLREFWWSLDI
jgi:hypothetical protein